MALFIEISGLYNNDDIDYESLGLPVEDAIENAYPIPTLINIEHIVSINEGKAGRSTIEFSNGERQLFDISYGELKKKIPYDK